MVSYSRTDMKIPVRPAPLPPGGNQSMVHCRSTRALDEWGDGNDPFSTHSSVSRTLSIQRSSFQGEKKKPPPRPPPPKFSEKNQRKQVPSRPSSLLSGLFNRNTQSRSTVSQHSISTQQKSVKKETHAAVPTASLIDFHSPSCSPTPTTRSSSDGLSVNSFGSDGSVSNNGQTPGGGSSSQFESGFEDDFDFFGGLSSSSSFGTPLGEQKDPWSVVQSQDPFSPTRQQNSFPSSAPVQKVYGSSTFYKQTNVSSSVAVKTSSLTSMPTIIRAKSGRPSTLPKLCETTGDQISLFPVTASCNKSVYSSHHLSSSEFHDDPGNRSPPMPSIPPPPLPPEAMYDLDTDAPPPPELPPRPLQLQNEDRKKCPYGIALYDFSATHPDDLSFQANTTVYLLHKINAEWTYGQVGQNQGMFPTSFVKIAVPLSDNMNVNNHQTQSPAQIAKALYSFKAETWDDLEFEEGSSIYVMSRIDKDWLYGESDGKYGQFPASFIEHIPPSLPQHDASLGGNV